MAIDVDVLIKNIDSPGGGDLTYRVGDIISYKVHPHNGWGLLEDPRHEDARYGGDRAAYPFWLVMLANVPDEETIKSLVEPVISGAETPNAEIVRNRRYFIDENKIPNNVLNALRRDGYRQVDWSLVGAWLTDRGIL